MNRSAVGALLVVVMLLACVPFVVYAADHYTITVENGEIDIPAQTVDVEGQEFTISSVAPIEPGEDLTVSVSAPDDGQYSVHIYDEDYNIVDTERFAGDDTTTYDTETIAPGTYSLVVEADGVLERIQPVVITAYETTVSAPDSVAEDESFTVDISTIEHDGVTAPDIETVEVVIADDTTTAREPATEVEANEEYTATIDGYDPGEYRLYVSVSASDDPDDDSVDVISLSDEHSLTVTEATTDDDDDGAGGGGDGGGGGATDDGTTDGADDEVSDDEVSDDETDAVDDGATNGTDDSAANTTDEDPNATDDTDDVTNTTDGTDDTDAADDASTADDSDGDDSDGTTADGDGVITPQDDTTDTDTDDEAALGGVQLLVGILLAVGMVMRFRRT